MLETRRSMIDGPCGDQMDKPDADRLTSWTLGAIKERDLSVEGYCLSVRCGHFYVFNIDNLIASAGADYVMPEILPGVACAECGGALKFQLAMIPPEGD